jgi:mRNA-degrading endonuclease RelE of RelBE toxin-antitoxin system
MRYDIILAPQTVEDLSRLRAYERAAVCDALKAHLRHEPKRVSKARIKRQRGMHRPQYRLRVAEIRVFYDVTESAVEVLAIVPKTQAMSWLESVGKPE